MCYKEVSVKERSRKENTHLIHSLGVLEADLTFVAFWMGRISKEMRR